MIYYSAKFIEFSKNIFVNFFYDIFQMFSQKSIENASKQCLSLIEISVFVKTTMLDKALYIKKIKTTK